MLIKTRFLIHLWDLGFEYRSSKQFIDKKNCVLQIIYRFFVDVRTRWQISDIIWGQSLTVSLNHNQMWFDEVVRRLPISMTHISHWMGFFGFEHKTSLYQTRFYFDNFQLTFWHVIKLMHCSLFVLISTISTSISNSSVIKPFKTSF